MYLQPKIVSKFNRFHHESNNLTQAKGQNGILKNPKDKSVDTTAESQTLKHLLQESC